MPLLPCSHYHLRQVREAGSGVARVGEVALALTSCNAGESSICFLSKGGNATELTPLPPVPYSSMAEGKISSPLCPLLPIAARRAGFGAHESERTSPTPHQPQCTGSEKLES